MPNPPKIENSESKSPGELLQGIVDDSRRLLELEIKLVGLRARRQIKRVEKRFLIILLAFALIMPALYHLGDGVTAFLNTYVGLSDWVSKLIVSALFALPFGFLVWKAKQEET